MSRSPILVPLIVGCAQFMHQFDAAVITTALPAMAASLHEDPLRLNLAITCYLLSLAVFVPISGWMADRHGTRRVFLGAILLFSFSSAMCGLSRSLPALVLWRTLQGIGGAMMSPVGRVVIVKSVPKPQIVKAMNYITIPAVLGPVLGPSVGGLIVTYFSWPWIFFLNVPIGIAGVFLVHAFIPDIREESPPPLDLRGFVLTGVAMAGLVFGFVALGRGFVPTSIILGSIFVGGICGSLYLFHARRALSPIIDLALLRIRTFRTSLSGGGLFYLGTTAQVFLLALLLQLCFGWSAFHAGLMTLSSAAGSVVMRFTLQPILRWLGFRLLLVLNGTAIGLSLIACGLFRQTTPLAIIVVVLLIGGFARSIHFTTAQSLAYADIPPEKMSRATSFAAMAQQLLQSVGVGLTALIVHLSLLAHGRTELAAEDVGLGYFAIGAAALGSAFIFWRMPAQAGATLTERKST